MYFCFFVLLHLSTINVFAQQFNFGLDPDSGRSIEQLVHSHGYTLETYSITTEDDYILTLHRIVPRHYCPTSYNRNRKAVIVQHGLFGASTDFLINAPYINDSSKENDNFAFALLQSDQYDVWLPNTRGNDYSQQHVHWSKNVNTEQMEQLEYWNFSFDHIARYDLPAILMKVCQISNSTKVAYVGYSQGATSMFALLSSKPEIAQMIEPFVAWAPVVYMQHIESPFRFLAPMSSVLRSIGNRFAPSSSLISAWSHPLCKLPSMMYICSNALFMFGGFDTEHLNSTRLPVYFHFTPATVSTWQVVHYLQLIKSNRFQHFDHEKLINIERYGSEQPPEYNLNRISPNITIVFIRSQNDYLSSIPDTDRLIQELRNRSHLANVVDHLIDDPVWSHLDFTLGIGAGKQVYQPTINYLNQFIYD